MVNIKSASRPAAVEPPTSQMSLLGCWQLAAASPRMESIATCWVLLPVITIEPCGEPIAAPVFLISVAFPISPLEVILPAPNAAIPGSPAATALTSRVPLPSAEYLSVVVPVLSKTPSSVPLAPPVTNSGPGQTTFRSAGFTSKLPLADPRSTETSTFGAKTNPTASSKAVDAKARAR